MHIRAGNSVYYIYIVTDRKRSKLETGITGDLSGRISRLEHDSGGREKPDDKGPGTDCSILLYWEKFDDVEVAVAREQELRSFSKRKKEQLIEKDNREWKALNEDIHRNNHSLLL